MLSDTLFDTARSISGYLEDYPEIYTPYEEEIRQLLADMERLQRKLDAPPCLNHST